jgi:serine/threonine protein kinase
MSQPRSGIHTQFSESFRRRFRVEEILGKGGSAVVYLATQVDLQRPVALKVLAAVGFDEGDAKGRFTDEARLASRLDHPNLCRLYEFGQDNGHAYLVYEYVAGEDLAARLIRQKETGRAGLDLPEALTILTDIARGLEYAHKLEVVHRDLKPANILLSSRSRAKITDFGLAKMGGLTRVIKTETGMVVGTPECMAPEQALGREVGPEADVYALGCLVFWMLAGHPPFQDESAGKVMISHIRKEFPALDRVRPGLGSGICCLLDEMVRRKPERRPTPTEVLRAVKVLGARSPARSVEVSQALSRQRMNIVVPKKSFRYWVVAPVLLLLSVLMTVLGWWWMTPREMPLEVEVFTAPNRVRFRWSGPRVGVEVRPQDGSEDWRKVEAAPWAGGWEAGVEGLDPDEVYLWRFWGESTVIRAPLRTLPAAEVEGVWPRYDEAGNPVGWLLKGPDKIVLGLKDGSKALIRGDGLAEVGEGAFYFQYPGGLAEQGPSLGDPPNLMTGLKLLLGEISRLRVKEVLFAALRASRRGEIPSLAARRAALSVYSRWRGLEPALRQVVPRLSPAKRVDLYVRLDRLQAIDRALRDEGLSPVFGSQEVQRRCLTLSYSHRGDDLGGGEEAQVLVTGDQYQNQSRYRDFRPIRRELPPGRGGLRVRLLLEDLWADRFLVLRFEGAGKGGELELPLRPPCRRFRFRGEVNLLLPETVVREYTGVSLHVRKEDFPTSSDGNGGVRFPFFKEGETVVPGIEVRLLLETLARDSSSPGSRG